MKTSSLRVDPSVVAAVIRHINNHSLKVTWKKEEHDSHLLFTGSPPMIRLVNTFVDGFHEGVHKGFVDGKIKLDDSEKNLIKNALLAISQI